MNADEPLQPILDRLVDGQLSPSESRELLARLDDLADGWRSCALAFLEDRALRSDLQALIQEAFDRPLAGAGEMSASGTRPKPGSSEPGAAVAKTAPAFPRRSLDGRATSSLSRGLTLAGMLLLSLAFGMAIERVTGRPRGAFSSPSEPGLVAAPPSHRPSNAGSAEAMFAVHPRARLQLEDPSTGSSRTLDLPLTRVSDTGPVMPPPAASPWVTGVQQLIGAEGLVQTDFNMVPFQTRDGRTFVLPVYRFDPAFQ